ncbi:MAG: voltage-gated potassium channel [Verrucomicrobia bacterium]|nr:MAG: voltage-gated potassium channel [Verrucomicrobiota bacterium]
MNRPATETPQVHFLHVLFTDPQAPSFLRWQRVLNLLIFVSCIAMAFETVEPFATTHQSWFFTLECVAVAFFSIDYIANLYFAEDRVRYMFSFWGLVDLISILPSYLMILNLTALQGAKVFRLLRVVRVLRVLKMARTTLMEITSQSKSSNPIIANLRIYLIALFSVMMISSTLMYYVEGGFYSTEALSLGQSALEQAHASDADWKALPEADRKFLPVDPIGGNPMPPDKQFFASIPAAMWWCIVTLTTTGYGDMYPVSFGGRVIAGVTMLLGLVLFGILMNIVGKTLMVLLFGEQIDDSRNEKATKESVVKTMLEINLISGAQHDELLALSPEQIRERLGRRD